MALNGKDQSNVCASVPRVDIGLTMKMELSRTYQDFEVVRAELLFQITNVRAGAQEE